jgi:hypothetical protein
VEKVRPPFVLALGSAVAMLARLIPAVRVSAILRAALALALTVVAAIRR